LQKSGISDYALNAYTGCVHGCVYCYARFMKRFTNHPEPWGAFLDAKVNAPELLKKELGKRRQPLEGEVFLSSVTDPYQPAEKKYRLTRGLLESLLEHQATISILTKSDLVVRDIDLLKEFKNAKVGLSMSTPDDCMAKYLEPRASAPSQRLEALRQLHAAGIYTWAFLSPYLPTISDLETSMGLLQGIVNEVGVEAINMLPSYWTGVEKVLSHHAPERLELCRYQARDDGYWVSLEKQARRMAEEMGASFMGLFRHGR
jgi:DNA repair photolyase